MVTKFVRKQYTPLLIDLAVMVRKKDIVNHLHEYGIVCSYDELKKLRSSAVYHGSKGITQSVLLHHSKGFIQAVADNFDCNISSMNGLKQTHSLAMMMLQAGDENGEEQCQIDRLTSAEIKDNELPDVNFVQYKGPKKPEMPKNEALQSVPALSIIAKGVLSAHISSEFDFQFLKSVIMIPGVPEYSGFNTKKARESG